jgi:hypothetical protein
MRPKPSQSGTRRPVSKWFRFDWQYILKTGRLPAFKPVTFILAGMPMVVEIARIVSINTTGFWLLWCASIASLLAFAVTFVRCPAFVREYERFDDYEEYGHSHRWIGWLFYNNYSVYSKPENVVREAVEKGLTVRADAVLSASEFAVSPIISADSKPEKGIAILKPTVANRDLYIGLWIDGLRHVMALQEEDPKIRENTKELFWLMFTDLTSSRLYARIVVWSLYGIAFVLSAIALLMNVAKPFGDAGGGYEDLQARGQRYEPSIFLLRASQD